MRNQSPIFPFWISKTVFSLGIVLFDASFMIQTAVRYGKHVSTHTHAPLLVTLRAYTMRGKPERYTRYGAEQLRHSGTRRQPALLRGSDCGFRAPGISSANAQTQLHNVPSVRPHLACLRTLILNRVGLVELQPQYELAVICLKAKVAVVSFGIQCVSGNVKRRRRAKVRIHMQILKLKKLAVKQCKLGERSLLFGDKLYIKPSFTGRTINAAGDRRGFPLPSPPSAPKQRAAGNH